MDLYRKKVFPALAALLWLLFLLLDLTRTVSSTPVKFAAICLCGVTALLGAKTFDGALVALALCFTVAADWFLLVRDEHYQLGVGLFIAVQLLYAFRLYRLRGARFPKWALALRVVSLLFCWYLAERSIHVTCGAGIPLYMIFSLFYFANLCINTAEAFVLGKNQRIFAVGLLLFVCCDICVGAWNLGLLPGFTRIGMWLFYLPSQALIVLSQNQEKEDPDEKTV